MDLLLAHQAGMEDSLVLNSSMMKKVELVGSSVLVSLAMVHSIDLVVLEEVELVVRVVLAVLAVLVEHSACVALLVRESIDQCGGAVLFEEVGLKPSPEWRVAEVVGSWDIILSTHSRKQTLPYPP